MVTILMPHEETRKIIRVGNSYAVTIPRSWLRYFNLTEKDHVKVISNSTIVIEAPQTHRKDKVKIEA